LLAFLVLAHAPLSEDHAAGGLWPYRGRARWTSPSLPQGLLLLEEAVDGPQDRRAQLGPMLGGTQLRLVLVAREVAELDQDRRHVGRLEHGEPGKSVAVPQQQRVALQLLHQKSGEARRQVLGFP